MQYRATDFVTFEYRFFLLQWYDYQEKYNLENLHLQQETIDRTIHITSKLQCYSRAYRFSQV